MAKYQFQAAEGLKIIFPAPFNKTTGHYNGDSDALASIVVKRLGAGSATTYTTLSSPAIEQDPDTKHWSLVIPGPVTAGSYLVAALPTDATNCLPQMREYEVGDYVEDITATKTDVLAVKTVTDGLPAVLGTPDTGHTIAGDVAQAIISANSADTNANHAYAATGINVAVFGDSLAARIGAPGSGHSLLSNIEDVKADTAAIKAVTDALPTPFPTNLATLDSVNNVGSAVAALDTKIGVPAVTIAADIGASSEAITFIQRMQGGRWKIAGTQLVCYYRDGSSWVEFARFDLLDDSQAPSSTRIFERVPV